VNLFDTRYFYGWLTFQWVLTFNGANVLWYNRHKLKAAYIFREEKEPHLSNDI